MNDITFLGLSDAATVVWVCTMAVWTIIQGMFAVARQFDQY